MRSAISSHEEKSDVLIRILGVATLGVTFSGASNSLEVGGTAIATVLPLRNERLSIKGCSTWNAKDASMLQFFNDKLMPNRKLQRDSFSRFFVVRKSYQNRICFPPLCVQA